MKRIFYFLAVFVGVTLTGCEPMEDIHEEIDQELDTSLAVGTTSYTLTEEDYASLEIDAEGFNSVDEAGELIPFLLSDLYPVYGDESAITVTFNLFDPITPEEYSVSAADYEAVGLTNDYFANISQVQSFLSYQFPRAEAGDHVELTYNAVANEISYTLTADDFDLIGEEFGDDYPAPASNAAQFNSFDRREGNANYWSDEMVLEAINTVLLENVEDIEGQTYFVTYDIYTGSSGSESMTVLFNGNNYVPASNSTSFELSNANYALVGDELADDYPGPAGNAAQYNSFAVDPDNNNYWNQEMLLEAINIILKDEFPSAEDGSKFAVTYAAFSGGSVSSQLIPVVLSEDTYVIDNEDTVSTVETTNVFAFTNGTWNMPLTLTSEDYTTMGQRFPNFDDEAEAYQMISVFLGMEYPYAREGDMRSIAYNFYSSGSTSTRYSLFVFEDGEWNAIPRTIEQTIQFSHDGTTWEPDNTIRYNLTGPDYDRIAELFADVNGFQSAASNLAQYGNFNLNNWEEEMIFEALTTFLNDLDPSAEVGQQYILSYEVYPGYVTVQMSLIKDENGEWIINE